MSIIEVQPPPESKGTTIAEIFRLYYCTECKICRWGWTECLWCGATIQPPFDREESLRKMRKKP